MDRMITAKTHAVHKARGIVQSFDLGLARPCSAFHSLRPGAAREKRGNVRTPSSRVRDRRFRGVRVTPVAQRAAALPHGLRRGP